MLNFVSDLAQVGEVRHIASCNILAVNNNPLEDFPSDFCFVMKLTSLGVYVRPGAQGPSIQIR